MIRIGVIIGCLLCNAAVFFLLHLVFRGNGDIMNTLRKAAGAKLSYQSLHFIYGILLLWVPVAACTGFAIRSAVLSRLGEDTPFIPPENRRCKRLLTTFDLSLLGIVILSSMAFSAGGVRHLKLNEICDAKVGRVSNGGYIELFNEGSLPCRTRRLYLSNDEENLKKYELPDMLAEAGGLLLVPLEKDVFTLNKSGGSVVILSDSSGRIIDKVVADKPRSGNYSYCRADSTDRWNYMHPTPGEENDASAAILQKPAFSAAAGYYSSEFDLTLTAEEGTEIHYTTDGSLPTKDSPVYTKPIRVTDPSDEPPVRRSKQNIVYDWKNYTPLTEPVKKAFLVRAVAMDANGAMSEQACASYFIGQRFDSSVAVISLAVDDEDVFGEDGIYVTGKQYDEWYLAGGTGDRPTANFDVKGTECPVNVEFFANGRKLTFSQNGGLRIQGGSTRWLPLKRLSVFSRKEYSGRSTFPAELFKGKATHSVMLRDGLENALSMYTVPDRDVAVLESIPVTVYINGEYWYDTFMQEKYNNTYFRQTFGVENVEFLKVGITDEIKNFLDTHDLSVQENYEKFGEMVDIQSYIDYICANVFLGNTDYNEYANTAIWRTVSKENDSYGDGRWRWAFYDMDLQTAGCRSNYGLTDITDAQLDTFNIVCDWDPPVNERIIYCALKANPEFRKQFVLSMTDMINTDFTEERMSALLKKYGQDISWHDYFFRERPDNMMEFTAKEFNLKNNTGELTIQSELPEAGSVRVNTSVIDLSQGSWTGRYFTEYSVSVTAIPNPGYTFKGWSNGKTDATIEIPINGGVTINAVFEKE
ncbi:MAG: CotH kinase family protein [Clostridia bacterium]|nr:CotH kinase family protein [Clostridia bacterium]